MCLVFADKVKVLKYSDRIIHGVEKVFRAPAVLVLMKVVRSVYRGKVPFSKKNVLVRDRFACAYCGKTGRLLPDLARAWRKPPAQVAVSRIYGKDGAIHDPRTGVTSNRIKEVWKGRLDEFLEGWRRMRG